MPKRFSASHPPQQLLWIDINIDIMCATTPDNSLYTIRWYLLKGVMYTLVWPHPAWLWVESVVCSNDMYVKSCIEASQRCVACPWGVLHASLPPPFFLGSRQACDTPLEISGAHLPVLLFVQSLSTIPTYVGFQLLKYRSLRIFTYILKLVHMHVWYSTRM